MVSWLSHPSSSSIDKIQARLLTCAALFLGFYAFALMLSPAARSRTWQVDYRWEPWIGFFAWLAAIILLHNQTARFLPNRDPYLLPVGALLSGWGILMIWRLTPSLGLRQSIWFLVATAIILLALRLPDLVDSLRRYKYLWLTSGLFLTALTLLFGSNPASPTGPRLWLGCCGFYIQPSEPLKLLLIIYLAAYLADHPLIPNKLLGLLAPTLIMTGLALLLLVVQRDLGTVSIFIFLYTIINYLGTRKTRLIVIGASSLLLFGSAGYLLFDVVRLRINAWINPWLDPSGRSYQIVQSLISIGNGGLLGRGPGLGYPNLVPIPHSDFIFTSVAEETGLLGTIALLLLLALITGRGLQIALNSQNSFQRYLAAGVSAFIVAQSVLIIGGNLRLLPLTGVTLPLVSYGGSSLVTALLSLFILLKISDHSEGFQSIQFSPQPYLYLGGFLFTGLIAVSFLSGWWSVYLGPSLVKRTDNPRRAIADMYVHRGALLDRHDIPLVDSTGVPGNFERQTLYPDLGPVIGYTHPIFGQAGLEASMDDYLRGLLGNPGLTVWWYHLLYGQPPPGLDIRLTLDLELQRDADELLGERASALVLMNADSGEILAMASHPTFDPNLLDSTWEQLTQDSRSPLINRAALGSYQPGTSLGVFLLAAANANGDLPALPQTLDSRVNEYDLSCARIPNELTWASVIANGCPEPQAALGRSLGSQSVLQTYTSLGFYTAPKIRLPTTAQAAPLSFQNPRFTYMGQADVSVSPLQMALAAATISSSGERPAPRLAAAVNTPAAGWVILPPLEESIQVFSPTLVDAVAESLAAEGLPIWQILATTPNGSLGNITWYIAGTQPSWNGTKLSLAILLEEDNPELAEVIGRAMLQAALQP